MRSQASVLHLDMDAFYASVEQRDKPSLRGRAVVVGGVGARGVVATASYEARVFGVRSAMPAHEARRRCPHAAFLSARFGAYQESSARVMAVLRALSPRVEPLSLDEAFVDLESATRPVEFSAAGLHELVGALKAEVAAVTGGLTASVGVGSSKFMAKVASELDKPDGVRVVPAGTEAVLLAPMSLRVVPGVGPVTYDKLARIGLRTVGDVQRAPAEELVGVVGRAAGEALHALAHGRDDRPVEPEREAKSISVEDTFETDVVAPADLDAIATRHAGQVATRLAAAGLFARTVTVKVRLPDFTTYTRSRTLRGATDRPEVVAEVARSLVRGVDTRGGVRLLGVGVAGLTDLLQEDLFADVIPDTGPDSGRDTGSEELVSQEVETGTSDEDRSGGSSPALAGARRSGGDWPAGVDVEHAVRGRGWVWGSGRGRVTVRFETRTSPSGPVATFAVDDADLRRADPQPLPGLTGLTGLTGSGLPRSGGSDPLG